MIGEIIGYIPLAITTIKLRRTGAWSANPTIVHRIPSTMLLGLGRRGAIASLDNFDPPSRSRDAY